MPAPALAAKQGAMPEGDTILRTAKTLAKALVGQTVTHFESAYAQPSAAADQSPLEGQTVSAVRALGKHVLMEFSGGLTLRSHMRMNGSWHIYRPGEPWQRPRRFMRVLVETPAFVAVGFDVPVVELLSGKQLARHPALAKLGPDLLAPEFDEAQAVRRMEAQGAREVGEVLLDQKVCAGIGNEYKSEVLFLCGIDPRKAQSELTAAQRLELYRTARKLMLANVTIGGEGPVTYSGLRRTTRREDPRARAWVYGRSGERCRTCGARIVFFKQGDGARSTYVCPTCQAW
jgi:endonuclease-8